MIHFHFNITWASIGALSIIIHKIHIYIFLLLVSESLEDNNIQVLNDTKVFRNKQFIV